MQLVDPQKHVGGYVRIRPHGGSRHFGRGRLLRVEGDYAIVRPFGHGRDERVPVTDLHSWAAGNPAQPRQRKDMNQEVQEVQEEGPWVVADIENVRFFVSPWAGFKPELNRARLYDRLRSVRHAASIVRRRPAEEVGRVEVLTVGQAQQLIQDRFHPQPATGQPTLLPLPAASEPPPEALPPATSPLQAVPPEAAPLLTTPSACKASDLSQASADDLRTAADILRRMADAEVMVQEAIDELERIRAEWRAFEQKLTGTEAVQP